MSAAAGQHAVRGEGRNTAVTVLTRFPDVFVSILMFLGVDNGQT